MKHVAVVLLLVAPLLAQAKDHQLVTIKVVAKSAWDRARNVTLPGSNSRSSTTCNGSTIGDDTYSQSSANCSTETNPGTPPTTFTKYTHQVLLGVVMPDGSQAILWCQQQWRSCTELSPGTYQAELDNSVAWIYVTSPVGRPKYNQDGTLSMSKTRTDRVKYQIQKVLPGTAASVSEQEREVWAIGRSMGYPDSEISEAITSEGVPRTLDFLRREQAKRKTE